jgi:hypothetical protein
MTKARVKGTDAAAFVKSQAQLKAQESKVRKPPPDGSAHCQIFILTIFVIIVGAKNWLFSFFLLSKSQWRKVRLQNNFLETLSFVVKFLYY